MLSSLSLEVHGPGKRIYPFCSVEYEGALRGYCFASSVG